MRHAIAAEQGPEWPDDDLRPLTERGIARFRKAVDGFATLGLKVDEVWTSPLVRARQTAELLAAGLSDRPPVKQLTVLAPGHPPVRIVDELARATPRRRLAVVGHEPDLGELAAFLMGTRRAIPFKKGSICRIDVESSGGGWSGTLSWFASPRLLRHLTE
ncbi:MAG: phosphohistidine phosphatase [Acidobacteria bacterium]|nr:phosphohistidine phosphatase [Acidobacteriota bacterium]